MANKRAYATMYERLLANTRPVDPDNPQSCWLWIGELSREGYGRLTVRRIDDKQAPPRHKQAHRVMLEEVLDAEFPHDDGGHLCNTPGCIHPDHLEVQAPYFNLSLRRGYRALREDRCLIPTLFPREDPLQRAADRAWDEPGTPGNDCPF